MLVLHQLELTPMKSNRDWKGMEYSWRHKKGVCVYY
jgi:hypothetical protein